MPSDVDWTEGTSLLVACPEDGGSIHKPAMCDLNGTLFVAWGTRTSDGSTPLSSFSFTTRLDDDSGFARPTVVPLNDSSTHQSHTSALVVFEGVLYALIPIKGSGKGLTIFSYDETTYTFQYVCDWSSAWNTPVAAVSHERILHVVGYDSSNNNLVWTWSNPNLTKITSWSDFSSNTTIQGQTSSNPALMVRNHQVVLLYLSNGDRSATEMTLTMAPDNKSGNWAPSSTDLSESGNSGISATSTPNGSHAWICFKKHNGDTNLVCHWNRKRKLWGGNDSMGDGVGLTKNEGALAFSGVWVYRVWNWEKSGSTGYLMMYSRRPMAKIYMNSWMGDLTDQSISIADLSIPGTHDSATFHYDNVSAPSGLLPIIGRLVHPAISVPTIIGSTKNTVTKGLTRCQDMSITEQLDAGIRYFDLRAAYPDGKAGTTITAFHGEENLGITFQSIFQDFYDWLAENSSEGIIAQIKSEAADALDQTISDGLYKMINGNSHWVTTNTIPTLDQIRGKIQLVRRFVTPKAASSSGFGINATPWGYNKKFTNDSTPGVTLEVDDRFEIPSNGADALLTKTGYVQGFINRATSPTAKAGAWFIGYSSYTTHGQMPAVRTLPSTQIPDTNWNYATKRLGGNPSLNAALKAAVEAKGGWGTPARVGTIVMDYPEAPSGTLIDRIVYTNNLKPL